MNCPKCNACMLEVGGVATCQQCQCQLTRMRTKLRCGQCGMEYPVDWHECRPAVEDKSLSFWEQCAIAAMRAELTRTGACLSLAHLRACDIADAMEAERKKRLLK